MAFLLIWVAVWLLQDKLRKLQDGWRPQVQSDPCCTRACQDMLMSMLRVHVKRQ